MSICIVIVTYGRRLQFLRQVLSALSSLADSSRIAHIIVVNNGAYQETADYLAQLGDSRLKIVTFEKNMGSASGYSAGLKAAERTGCQYLWLLDDDNVPNKNALTELLKHYEQLADKAGRPLALLSLRDDREHLKRIAQGVQPSKAFPRRSSFLGFHMFNLLPNPQKKLRLNQAATPASPPPTTVAIPYAPYGGLFFHRRVLATVGYPNEKLFLYGDDSAFSYGITQYGGKIYLVPTSIITDVDRSWHIKAPSSAVLRLLKAESEFRVYYSVRNQVYFETHVLPHNVFLHALNKCIFMMLLHARAHPKRDHERLRLLRQAIQDGENARLGQQERWQLK